MTLWILLALMALAAGAVVAFPMYKAGSVLPASVLGVVVIAASFLLYRDIGQPQLTTAAPANQPPDINAMVQSLADRLEDEPENLDGWKMLGRSYLTLGRYREAATAFRRAAELESNRNGQTLVDLGEAELAAAGQQFSPEIAAIFESALALEPNNPSALFWSGIAAANRDDIDTAASRWERLLATQPPPEIRQLIEARVAQWRGLPPPSAAATEAPPQAAPVAGGLSLSVSLPEQLRGSLPPDATVFVIARDPGQPAPPVAVARRRVSDLPLEIELTDADAMIPGRVISAFDVLEVLARVSLSGQPVAQAGDWFAEASASPGESIELIINRQVP